MYVTVHAVRECERVHACEVRVQEIMNKSSSVLESTKLHKYSIE